MTAFQLDTTTFVSAYRNLWQQLHDLDQQLATINQTLSHAKDSGSSGSYQGVGEARGNAARRAISARSDIVTLRNELATFLHNAYSAYKSYERDSSQGAAMFKALDSGLEGRGGKGLLTSGASKASKSSPDAQSGGMGDSEEVR